MGALSGDTQDTRDICAKYVSAGWATLNAILYYNMEKSGMSLDAERTQMLGCAPETTAI